MATPSKTPKQQGGFDCEFIKHPPEEIQVECPVCLLVVREPHQVTCCGYAFCRTCIERVQLQKSACPTCNKNDFSVFPDKRLQRLVYAYQVCCSHKKEGCQWTGNLGELDKHLNNKPDRDEQLRGCVFTEVECIHCPRPFQRRYVNAHQTEECPQRPFTCKYCNDYESTHEDVVTNHWPKCHFHPVPCPNECGENPKRQQLDHHVSKDCPLTVVNCDFHYTGCEVQLPRKDMPAHLAENLVIHTTQMVTCMQEKVQEKDEQIAALKLETQTLKNVLTDKDREIAQLKAKQEEDCLSLQILKLQAGILPIEVTMTEFTKHKQNSDTWYSEPFYTHPLGYQMCLNVDANGFDSGKGTHISVFGCLMRGRYDDRLKWPFQCDITFQMINQLQDKEHRTKILHLSNASGAYTSRVTTTERATEGWGYADFLPHSELGHDPAKNRQYLKDDCLRFRVTQVTNIC